MTIVEISFPGFQFASLVEGLPYSVCVRLMEPRCGSCRAVSAEEVAFRPRLRVVADSREGRGVATSASPRRRESRHGDTISLGGGVARIVSGGDAEVVVPASELTAPSDVLRQLFDVAVVHSLALQSGCVLHGSAFVVDGVGALALGRSGAGKSTLSAVALRCFGKVVADDSVIAGPATAGDSLIAPFRRDLYLREPSQRVVPPELHTELRWVEVDGAGRWLLRRGDAEKAFRANLRPSVVWDIRVDRRRIRTEIERYNQAETLSALIRAANPLYMGPRYPIEREAVLPVLAGLAQSCAGARVRLGRDMVEEPRRTMRRLLVASTG